MIFSWYHDILDDICFQILRLWHTELTKINLLNLWFGSWDCDNSIEKKSNKLWRPISKQPNGEK
jgi:hypothetical protein